MTNTMTDRVQLQHARAMVAPRPGHERAIRAMLCGLREYAEAHRERYESPIGEDYVMGESWARGVQALRGLLNGETGRFDCGTLDREIRDLAKEHGIDLD